MTSRQTTSEPPVSLPDPTRPPRPAPGCGVCQALDKQRAEAERGGDVRRATMFEVEMRRHPRHREGAA
ncbi:hypothetical protein PV728_32020 [Streptomyces europaeiscabiei]|uniref:hypothetical protein n=1 Tax=Streptomyces europaeiscabiei TaxID=146819 RepID=UPI0029B05D28|nr:hypothetical protein [Streptomyces europaeiscabiei]MDX3634805.1 hypothetical protein [Streptomyces europaeiscabiei]MDX3652761.1 hypothetical protein [Streptomyces europaeiscabiei]